MGVKYRAYNVYAPHSRTQCIEDFLQRTTADTRNKMMGPHERLVSITPLDSSDFIIVTQEITMGPP